MLHEPRIKQLREKLSWNQQEMADYLGLDRSSVSRMERGRKPKGPVQRLLDQLEQRHTQVEPCGSASREAAE